MIINTITCHDVYNYGASLQAYALQEFLKCQGHQVSIIDYKPDYLEYSYDFWFIPSSSKYYSICQKNFLIKCLYCLYLYRTKRIFKSKDLKFRDFKKNYLQCTRKYNTVEELRLDPPKADVYIAGSDQVWNTQLENGKDPAFFLDFGGNEICRLSYAASFAIDNIDIEIAPRINKYLCKFKAISVRETTGLNILNNLGLSGVEVLDPVFLLNKTQWKNLIGDKPIIKTNYIFVYDLFVTDDKMRQFAEHLANTKHIPLVVISGKRKVYYGDYIINDAGPVEFLNYLYFASHIISDSFHATAFAVLFNRNFSVFYERKNVSRIKDFLSLIQLSHLLNPDFSSTDNNIDWEKPNSLLNQEINRSKVFLISNIKDN